MDGKVDDTVNMDRISELPTFIIHHIMSYLSIKEVAQISVLSNRWNQFWKSFPNLDFDQTYFLPIELTERDFLKNKKFGERLKKFNEFVDASLVRFSESNSCIQKLRLHTSLLNVRRLSSVDLDKWMALIFASGVRELDFNVECGFGALTDRMRKAIYTLPPTIFSAKSVTVLNLCFCKLDLEQPSDTSISLHSLKKLSLHKVCISEMMVQKLTGDCTSLEDLVFSRCWGLKFLCVSKARKLKIMKITTSSGGLKSVKIVAPSLQQFTFSGKLTVIDMAGCPHLNKLRLEGATFTDQEFHQLISNFPLLEDLHVVSCNFLRRITISSTHLRKLSLFFFSNLEAIEVDAPSLLSFNYEDYSIPTFSINCTCPLNVAFQSDGDIDTRWYLKLKEFIGLSNQFEDLTISVGSCDQNSFELDEFHISSPSLPREVEKLSLDINTKSSNYAALLDGLLSTCFPKTLAVSHVSGCEGIFFEWLYDQLRNRDVSCCSSCDIKCWRHYLEDVKIESFLNYNDKKRHGMDDHDLINVWPAALTNGDLEFHVDWCFP